MKKPAHSNSIPPAPSFYAWQESGSPVHKFAEDANQQSCGLCYRQMDKKISVTKFASEKFTDWDKMQHLSLCLSCTWAYTELDNRLKRILITPSEILSLEDKSATTQVLHQSSSESFSIVVPVSGKKHVLPYAKWGTLTSDHGAVEWNQHMATIVSAIAFLRSLKVSEKNILQHLPYIPEQGNIVLALTAWELLANVDSIQYPLLLVLARTLNKEELLTFFRHKVGSHYEFLK